MYVSNAPALTFVLIFMVLLLSDFLKAVPMPIVNAPRIITRRLPGSYCAELG
jgi:hypothetical protein